MSTDIFPNLRSIGKRWSYDHFPSNPLINVSILIMLLFWVVVSVNVVSGVDWPSSVIVSPRFIILGVRPIDIFTSSEISLFTVSCIRILTIFSFPPVSVKVNSVLSADKSFGTVAVEINRPSLSISIDFIIWLAIYNVTLWFGTKFWPIILKSEPTDGLSGINLKDESSSIATIVGWLIFGCSAGVFPGSDCPVMVAADCMTWSLLSNAFQLIIGFSELVFIPNFTLWPGLTFSCDENTITWPPTSNFPIQPFSVLKDLNELSSPNQILTESMLKSFPLLFSNSNIDE